MINFFSIFDINIDCEINIDLLRQKYFELQKKHHPDYSKNRTIDIALINEGYQILSNQLLRLKHILELNTITLTETISDAEFLLQCMEWQENIKSFQQEIVQKMNNELNEAVFLIKSQNFILAANHLQKALYLNKLIL